MAQWDKDIALLLLCLFTAVAWVLSLAGGPPPAAGKASVCVYSGNTQNH